jgi:hypothetical protein
MLRGVWYSGRHSRRRFYGKEEMRSREEYPPSVRLRSVRCRPSVGLVAFSENAHWLGRIAEGFPAILSGPNSMPFGHAPPTYPLRHFQPLALTMSVR